MKQDFKRSFQNMKKVFKDVVIHFHIKLFLELNFAYKFI